MGSAWILEEKLVPLEAEMTELFALSIPEVTVFPWFLMHWQ